MTTECKLEKSEDHFIWLGSYQYHHIKTMKSPDAAITMKPLFLLTYVTTITA